MIVAVVGPTATGKTELAVRLGAHLCGAEMVVADSRQVVHGLPVGTCAPTAAELAGMPCHLLDLCDPGRRVTAAEWATVAAGVLDELAARRRVALLVGGTGLYVAAALDGLAFSVGPPEPAERARRDALAATDEGRATLVAELLRRDPVGAASVDPANPRRVVRALELIDAAGSLAAARRRGPGRPALRLGVDVPRPRHDELIRARAERMVRSGALAAETEAALAAGVRPADLERCGIGYREAIALLRGDLAAEAAVDAITVRTLRYAGAQRTWFRADPRVRWLDRGGEGLQALVDSALDALREDAGTRERLRRRPGHSSSVGAARPGGL